MLYLIGLGLNEEGISKEGIEALKTCKMIYIENYTVDFPYSIKLIEEMVGKKVKPADRKFVESLEMIDESVKKNTALLVYGNPMMATTHITIIDECRKSGVKCRIIHAASVFDAISETGLQAYKFGKTASMPKWQKDKGFDPDSFMDIVLENKSINAHTLILVDIGLDYRDALHQLQVSAEKKNFKKMGRIVVCSRLGNKGQRIYYDFPQELENKKIEAPFCIIIPGKMHFVEEEFLQSFDQYKK